jgi:soluble lytic murein transglycosylase-like protein
MHAAPPAIASGGREEALAQISTQQAIQQQLASIDKQRESLHRQLGKPADAAGVPVTDFFNNSLAILLQAPCPALDHTHVNELIADAADRYDLLPALLRAVMKQESAFKPCAISLRGAQGLMQLMPATAQQFHVSDPFEPRQNVLAGAAYLKQLLTRYKGDLRRALAAYNAGPVRADQQDSRPFPVETESYLTNIFADLRSDFIVSNDAEVHDFMNPSLSLPEKSDPAVQPVDQIRTSNGIPKN